MKELKNKDDIIDIVNLFYIEIRENEVLSPFFDNFIEDWGLHLRKMYDFWSTILINDETYTGNPVKAHFELNKEKPLKKEHFDLWLELFEKTIDKKYFGEKAEKMKTRAKVMAKVMFSKIEGVTI